MGYYKLTFNVYADKMANIKKNYVLQGEENPVYRELDGVTISDHKYDIFFWRDLVKVIDKDDIDKIIRIVVVEDKQAFTNIIKGAFLYQQESDTHFRIEFEYAPVIVNRQVRDNICEKESWARKIINDYFNMASRDEDPYDQIVSSRNIDYIERMFDGIQEIFNTGMDSKKLAYFAYNRSLIEIFGLDDDVFWALDSNPKDLVKDRTYMDKSLFLYILRTVGFSFVPLCEAFTHRYRLADEDRQKKILVRNMRLMRENISMDTLRFKNEETCAKACPEVFEMFLESEEETDSDALVEE